MSRTIDHNIGKRHVQKALELAERRAAEQIQVRAEIANQLDDMTDDITDAGYIQYMERIARNGESY